MSLTTATRSGTRSAGRHRAETTPVTPAETPDVRRSLARRLTGLAGNAMVALCVLTFLFLAVGPHLFDYRTSTMLTGSMEPGIMPGDVVVTVPKPAEDVKVGDVISYRIPVEDHRVETHRVTKVIHAKDGSVAIQTKGDNNSDIDPWTATLGGDTVWQMTAVVPKLGSAIRLLRSPAVQHGVLWVALGGLLLLGMSIIWGSSDDDENTPDDPGADDDANDDELEPHDFSVRDTRPASTPPEEALAA